MSSDEALEPLEADLVRLRSTYSGPSEEQGRASATELARVLKRIDAALERIRAGSFGICRRCSLQIELEYLKTDPATPFCRSCFEELVDQRQASGRGS